MKPVVVLLTAMVVFWQSGCSEATQPSAREVFVSIEVESAFQNDLVRLYLDNEIMLESRVSTNYSVSLAWSSGLRRLPNSPHFLYFEAVEYSARNGYRIDLTNDTSTVTINFDKLTKQIRFQQYKGRLFRD